MMRLSAGVAFLTLVLFMGAPAFSSTIVDDVAQGLTCQCGCGLTVANCNMPTCGFSVPMRGEISKMLDQGMDRPAIISLYRKKYGEKILSAPTTEGFNLLAWIMPFFALTVGGGSIVLMLGRWRHQSPSLPAGSDAVAERVPVIDPRLREKLEAEVKGHL